MTKNRIRTAVFIFSATLFFANSSLAQSQNRGEGRERPTFEQLIEKMDANEDGKLSKAEIKGPLKKNFDKVDTNEDGFISEEEFAEAPKPERRPKRQN